MQMTYCLSYICKLLYHIWFQKWYIHHVIVQPCQTCHNNNLNQPIIIMKAPSVAQHNLILSLLDSDHSGHNISSQTGVSNVTISRLCSRHRPYAKKASSGCPFKLSKQDIHYSIQLIVLARLKMQSKWPKHFRIAPTNPSQPKWHEMV